MYIPKYFRDENPDLIKIFIEQNGFAILVSEIDGRPWATHIPLLLGQNNDGNDILIGHVSKANKQWKSFENDKEVMAIFSGANAYISSSWYNHENVPTWNYEAVHVYGKIKITEVSEMKAGLKNLIDKYEKGMNCPVSIEAMTADFFNKEVIGLVGFEIVITEIQSVSKLSQNRDEENMNRIEEGLRMQQDSNSIEMAVLLAKRRK
jgi:transcriptional regulator